MSISPPRLELHHVSQTFGTQPVLDDISIAIQAGERLVLMGESGCGKSVTTKLLAGLLEPTSGESRWNGKPLASFSKSARATERLKLGYLFQSAALFDSQNVFDNIAFGPRHHLRMSRSDIADLVHDRLRDVGLPESAASKRPSELSGGMRKRVGLARALAMSPEVMIYDEPTTGLDPIMSDVINELILKTSFERNVTSIVVTHDMATVRRVATRIVMLVPLSRREPGEPQQIFEGTMREAQHSADERVVDFVTGNARHRLQELAA